MKVINDIIEWLVQTGLLSVLAIFFTQTTQAYFRQQS